MTALYRQPGSVLSFPIPIRNTLGQLADPDAQSVLLFANDVPQAIQGEGVTYRKEGDGIWFADADSSTAGMEAFFAEGNEISAWSKDVEIDGGGGYGDYLRRVYIIGVAPGSSGTGSQIVTLTVVDADELPILGIRVTVYDAQGRYAGTGVSDENGLIVLHLNPGTYALSSPSFPGAWQLANPAQTIVVTDGGSNLFDVEFVAMPITWPDVAKAAGWAVLLDEKGVPVVGASVFVKPIRAPSSGVNSEGVLPPADPWEKVSDAEGRVLFGPPEENPTEEELQHGMLQNWGYQVWGEKFGYSQSQRAIVNVPVDPPGGAFPLRVFIRLEEADA